MLRGAEQIRSNARRVEGQWGRSELDTTLGPAPVPKEVEAGLKEQRKRLSPEYEAVLKDAAPAVKNSLRAASSMPISFRCPSSVNVAGRRSS